MHAVNDNDSAAWTLFLGFQRLVFNNIAKIHEDIREIKESLAIIRNARQVQVGSSDSNEKLDFSKLPSFPIETVEGIQLYEDQLILAEERNNFVRDEKN